MLDFLAVIYGVHLVFLIYLISYFSVRGIFKGGAIPVLVTLGKFGIYYMVIVFGFKNLPHWGILVGFTGGLYLSLLGFCIWHWIRKKD